MSDGSAWVITDKALFAALPGGQAVIDWFGFCPSFHDATLESVAIAGGNASLMLRAFRMTDRTDEKGCFVLDRHARVVIRMRDVTGPSLRGDVVSIVSELTVRRLPANPTDPSGRPVKDQTQATSRSRSEPRSASQDHSTPRT